MDPFYTVVVSLAAVFAAAALAWRAGRASMPVKEQAPAPAPEPPDDKPPEETPEPPKAKGFHDLASDLDEDWSKSPTLDAFRQSEALKNAVEAAAASSDADLLGYARRGGGTVAILALECLARREERDHPSFEQILTARIDSESGTDREHAFALIHHTARGPVVPGVMKVLRSNLWKWDEAEEARDFGEFLKQRRDAGEAPSFGTPMPKLDPSDRSDLEDIFRRLPDDLVRTLRDELKTVSADPAASRKLLAGFARILEPIGDTLEDGSPLVVTPELEQAAIRLEAMLLGGEGSAIRCPLLVGEEGCGKSVLLRLAARRLQAAGFTVFEAAGPDIVSGQCYFGDLEKRVRGMLRALEQDRFVWLVPSVAELIPAGRTRNSETGVFDLVLLERRRWRSHRRGRRIGRNRAGRDRRRSPSARTGLPPRRDLHRRCPRSRPRGRHRPPLPGPPHAPGPRPPQGLPHRPPRPGPRRALRSDGPVTQTGCKTDVEQKAPTCKQVMYSVPKTVVDCFKFRSQIGTSVAYEALKNAWSKRKASADELVFFAKLCRVYKANRRHPRKPAPSPV